VEEYGVPPEGLKEHVHERARSRSDHELVAINATRTHRLAVVLPNFGSPRPGGPSLDMPSGEDARVGIDWELVDSASHIISPLITTSTVEDEIIAPSVGVFEPSANRLRAHFLPNDPSSASLDSNRFVNRPSSEPTTSPSLGYRPWNAAGSEASDDYDDFDHGLDFQASDVAEPPINSAVLSPLPAYRATGNARRLQGPLR